MVIKKNKINSEYFRTAPSVMKEINEQLKSGSFVLNSYTS